MDESICDVYGCDRPVLVVKRGWCSKHYQRWRKHGDPAATSIEWDPDIRLARDLEKRDDGCWIFHGNDANQFGHQRWYVGGKRYSVHRWMYERHVGPIPVGLVLDHLCRNPPCCNPQHLQPVTQQENLARAATTASTINAAKTHCKRGHEFTDANTGRAASGARYCRACRAAAARRYRSEARAS